MENNLLIKIPNFKLNVFRNLLAQSLMVDNQLMLEFTPELIKACSFSTTKTFIKLWTIPLKNLTVIPEVEEGILDFDNVKEETIDFPSFNFYILKGDLFRKYLSVHSSDTADIEFTLHYINGKYCAADIKISGKTEDESPLITNFILTTEELISNKIEDYSDIINECTPSVEMLMFNLTSKQMQEIKRLTKQLHNSSPDNTAFLNFNVDFEKSLITIKDKVFNISFMLNEDTGNIGKDKVSFDFNLLKSDFIMTGNHDFTFYANATEEKLIFSARYAGSIIMCLSSKIRENSIHDGDSILETSLDSLDIGEYIDDLPF